MGVALYDLANDEREPCSFNFWNYRAIVEAIRHLQILPDERVDLLHDLWNPAAQLSLEEARIVAFELRSKVLPNLTAEERVNCDGASISQEDFEELSKQKIDWNDADSCKQFYTFGRVSLLRFITFCEQCDGFCVRQ